LCCYNNFEKYCFNKINKLVKYAIPQIVNVKK
jgi:hypothetical protein